MALRSEALAAVPFVSPSLDLACGDGVFSFLHLGGAFDDAFDVFTAVGGLDEVRRRHADMFDHRAEDYRPRIVAAPSEVIDAGTDLKENMLHKAAALSLYGRLLRHDNNQPLPFDEASFQTVYCNAAYWVENIDGFLSEIRRITRPGGRIILQVKLDTLRRYTLEDFGHMLGEKFLDIIGRGRHATWPTLADRATWERRFASAGMAIESVTPFITRTHAHLWDIGLRPLAPLLVRMSAGLTPDTRLTIKREWVDLFTDLLEPFCAPDMDLFAQPDEPGELQYVLSPRSL